jgi:hypothetical protein
VLRAGAPGAGNGLQGIRTNLLQMVMNVSPVPTRRDAEEASNRKEFGRANNDGSRATV